MGRRLLRALVPLLAQAVLCTQHGRALVETPPELWQAILKLLK
jgi:hypothetical protein